VYLHDGPGGRGPHSHPATHRLEVGEGEVRSLVALRGLEPTLEVDRIAPRARVGHVVVHEVVEADLALDGNQRRQRRRHAYRRCRRDAGGVRAYLRLTRARGCDDAIGAHRGNRSVTGAP
jgi:hypothetical protein